MPDIQKLRSEIDSIHQEMAKLFKQRLEVTQKIWEIKKQQNLPLHDQNREDLIIHQFDQTTSDPLEQVALQNFFKCVLAENKKFLEARLK